MDSLELKVPAEDLDEHLAKVRNQRSAPDRAKHAPKHKSQQNKASEEQRQITATDRDLKELKTRNKNWQKHQDQRWLSMLLGCLEVFLSLFAHQKLELIKW